MKDNGEKKKKGEGEGGGVKEGPVFPHSSFVFHSFPILLGSYPSFTGFYWVLPNFTGFYLV